EKLALLCFELLCCDEFGLPKLPETFDLVDHVSGRTLDSRALWRNRTVMPVSDELADRGKLFLGISVGANDWNGVLRLPRVVIPVAPVATADWCGAGDVDDSRPGHCTGVQRDPTDVPVVKRRELGAEGCSRRNPGLEDEEASVCSDDRRSPRATT